MFKQHTMERVFKAGTLTVKIFENRQLSGKAAAETVVAKIEELFKHKQHVNIIFAAAPSQAEVLEGLRASGIDWSRVNAFHMDEYIGLSTEAPQRFGTFLQNHLFGHLPFRNVFYIDGNAVISESECTRYAGLLAKYPADIVCMGIGENGHLAFNDPPVADFNDPLQVKVVTLDEPCRQQQVNDGCFASFDEVPKQAITVTIPALLSAGFICCVVPASTKAEAVYNTINKEVSTKYPSTILRTHPNAVLFLDSLSSEKLKGN